MEAEATAATERELWVLRHAKAASDAKAGTDFDRRLTRRGRKDAPRLGRWMVARGLRPDHVVTSPARRAEETLTLLLEALAGQPPEVHRDERLYEAGLEALVDVVRDLPAGASRVLLVGHNPGLDDLVAWLSPEPPPRTEEGKLLTTAALARLRFPGPWPAVQAGGQPLLDIVRPKDL